MEYMARLLKAIEEHDLYPDVSSVQDVPYPEIIIGNRKYLCFGSNNYLGLSTHSEVKKAAMKGIEKYGIGTCDSRVVVGNLSILEELEQTIADFRRERAAMVFVSGFMANIGIIPALMDGLNLYKLPSVDNGSNLIICDVLDHISIFLGCMLSKSPRKTYLHKDMNHLEKILKKNKDMRKLIITDGVFSMDGDLAPLPEIVELAQMYNAMVMIDDAHATGVIGENGRGTPEHFGLEGKIDIVMGTLSKAVGGLGGYVTASPDVIKLLRVTAPSYIYSSSLPPEQAFGILAALNIIRDRPDLRYALWRNVSHLRIGLQRIGFDTLESQTQIIPVLIGEEGKCIKTARLLFEKGILAPSFISPVVPKGRARLRISVTALHTETQINRFLEILGDIGKKLEIV